MKEILLIMIILLLFVGISGASVTGGDIIRVGVVGVT